MSYTVSKVVKQDREPEIKGSKFYSYVLTLDEHQGNVEMLQKPETPAPTVGQVLEGTIEPGKQKEDGTKWPDKFKKAQQTFRPRDPKETAAIVRQHSQAMALAYAALGNNPAVDLEQIKKWTDWFDADVASVRDIPSKAPVGPPKPIREPAPTIPLDRAMKVLEAAQGAGLVEGTKLKPTLQAKLTEVGVVTGRLGHLNVDNVEEIEDFIKKEGPLG